MFVIVDSEFGKWEVFIPIVLFVVDVLAEDCLDGLVKSFGLAIGLGVKCCGEVKFCVEIFHECFPKFGSEF